MLEGDEEAASLPFVIEQVRHRVGGVVQFSHTLPAVHFPFDAIAGLALADTGAAVLRLTVSFDLFEIGGHGFKSGGLAPLREQYSRNAPFPGLLQNFTRSGPEAVVSNAAVAFGMQL